MTEIYLHFMCAHYGLSRNAPSSRTDRSDSIAELTELFQNAESADAPCFTEFGPMLPKLLKDSNPSALDKAIDAARGYAARAVAMDEEMIAAMAAPLIEKCISATR